MSTKRVISNEEIRYLPFLVEPRQYIDVLWFILEHQFKLLNRDCKPALNEWNDSSIAGTSKLWLRHDEELQLKD